MADLNNPDIESEVTFLSGVTSQGTIAGKSFWTWNDDAPASYSGRSDEAKWGQTQAGTPGTISIAFDVASGWSVNEKAAFTAAMHLWSAEANVTFNIVDPSAADALIERVHDRTSSGGIGHFVPGFTGSSQLGHATDGSVEIDPSAGGFGPIGASFGIAGGYPWHTIAHELGHLIGLGHAGAYNEGTTDSSPQLTGYDNTAYSVMSYNDAPDYSALFIWGSSGGYQRSSLTPMMLDIQAAERIYGAPVNTPLSGGQVFGFHSNIQGDIAQFFNFQIDDKPVITLFDTGLNNTLDVSGFVESSTVNLNQGTFSSVAGLTGNVGIAFGTRIDTAIGGISGDHLFGNDDGNVLMGGGGSDTISGGAGNDHIFGNMSTTTLGTPDGADVIDVGGGSNYVNGNAGDDTITAGAGSNRLYGGQGNDVIHVTGHGTNHLNGNLGDDLLKVEDGTNNLHGGQGNDTIQANGGVNDSFGDLGNDVIHAGAGVDHMTGGAGSDLFWLGGSANSVAGSWDEIADFTDGTDQLHLDSGLPLVLHASAGFIDESAAASYAQLAFGLTTNEAAALQVGNDTYLFYTVGAGFDAVVKLDGVSAAVIDQADFSASTTHL